MKNPFHLAIPVNDLVTATDFYENTLGCQRGRESDSWIDFNLFGHQLVCHVVQEVNRANTNPVDGDDVPVPHFGVILSFKQFNALAQQLKKKNQIFIIEPKIRFADQPGEQRTMFLKDPSGNALEFKAFKNLDSLFSS
ncbi:VOC family protein [Gammaproteobacteria bacterium]|nr:VOC family protein [Gammaproteobacteria bacterium]|tara:strand:- start:2470 stop:2883 length:414 start_codon:yes stop_codon:yes gene_type:complete